MNDQARDALKQVIRTYGAGICNTPRSCEMFIRQACGAFPDESRALIEALRQGVTQELNTYRPAEKPWEEFAGQLQGRLQRSGLDANDGRWAVEVWARVLGRHPENYVPPPEFKPIVTTNDLKSPGPDRAVKIVMTIIVALGGGLGGFFGSILVSGTILLTSAVLDMPYFKLAMRQAGITKVWLVVILVLVILGSIGFVFGAIGGAGGWLFGRGDRGHWRAFCTACGGAFVSSALGSYFVGIFGAALGSLLGSFGASMTTAARGGLG
jgi:hypothetical protein